MKILVLGGYGSVGKVIVADLATSQDVSAVLIGGRDSHKAMDLVTFLSNEKISFHRIDLQKESAIEEALRGIDVVVNATTREYNLPVMAAALRQRTHYLDLGGMFHITKKQLEMDHQFADAGLTALLCMGSCPGLSNVFAALSARNLDQIDEIHIRVGTRRGADFKGFNLSPKTQLAEFTSKPVIYEDGSFRELPPLSGRGTYRFSDPVGEGEGFYAIHSEVLTLPANIKGLKKVTYWVAFPPETLQKMDALINWGLTSEDPILVKDIRISPREFLDAFLDGIKPVSGYFEEHKALQVEGRGLKDGRPRVYRYETVVGSNKTLNVTCSAFWAGVPASIAAQMLGSGEITRRGVLAPEIALSPERLFDELEKRNIRVTEKIIEGE